MDERDQKIIAGYAEIMVPLLQAIAAVGGRGGMHWTYFVEKYEPCHRMFKDIEEIAERNGLNFSRREDKE